MGKAGFVSRQSTYFPAIWGLYFAAWSVTFLLAACASHLGRNFRVENDEWDLHMPEKSFTIEFYVGEIGEDEDNGDVADYLSQMVEEGGFPSIINGLVYEIRGLRAHGAHRRSFSGVFAKFRKDDLPHAGEPGGLERELDLAEEEGLIEKNHFIFYRRHNLLIYQRNRNGSSAGRFADYLSDYSNEVVLFQPVLQPEPARRLLRGEVLPRAVELSFARPTNPDMHPRNQWNRRVLELLNESGGTRMRIHITGDARSRRQQDRYLALRLKRAMTELAEDFDATVARIKVEEDGVEHNIDLVADRLLSNQDVEMDGRYARPDEMRRALRRAYDECRDELREFFGDGQAILD